MHVYSNSFRGKSCETNGCTGKGVPLFHDIYFLKDNSELESVARYGEKPRVLKFGNPEEEILGIVDLIYAFKQSHYKSLGIVCKTELQALEITEKLKPYTDEIFFLSNKSSAFVNGVVIASAHMAKGLEFDEVIIPQTDVKNYRSEIDRSMLYVAVTRTMHKFTLTYNGELTGFVEK